MAVINRTISPAQQRVSIAVRFGPFLLIAVAALLIVGLLRVVQTSQATTAGFAVQALQQDKLELETSLRQLEADVALLSSLARIEREAQRLGLAPAAEQAPVRVNVALPAVNTLPTRFLAEDAEESTDSSATSWWRSLLKPLPFN
ncbi:MAG: hypothetical protein IH866_06415 [Chloroflexi bacterium]|nr:hypothetical protein [Chloroflexota bacterium]